MIGNYRYIIILILLILPRSVFAIDQNCPTQHIYYKEDNGSGYLGIGKFTGWRWDETRFWEGTTDWEGVGVINGVNAWIPGTKNFFFKVTYNNSTGAWMPILAGYNFYIPTASGPGMLITLTTTLEEALKQAGFITGQCWFPANLLQNLGPSCPTEQCCQ